MARQARLAVAGLMHYVLLRGHNGMVVMTDGEDRRLFLQALREALTGCTLHGFALLDSEVHLLLRPAESGSLSRDVQALGRRFVAAYNRRHGRSGTPWDGRFRAAVVEPGAVALAVTQRVDQLGSTARPASGLIVDPPEWWALGNTPFEREAAYARRLADGLGAGQHRRITDAVHKGWPLGAAAFVQALAAQIDRPVQPRPRGRPSRTARL